MRTFGGLLAAIFLLGCSGDGGGGSDGGDGGAGGGDGACIPKNATVIVSDLAVEGTVSRLVVTESHVFVGDMFGVWAAPRDGGAVEKIFPLEGSPSMPLFPPFWLWKDDLLLGYGDTLWLLSIQSGEVVRTFSLPHPFTTKLSGLGDAFVAPDGKTFVGKNDPLVPDGTTPNLTYFAYDLESGDSTTILQDTDIGHLHPMAGWDDVLFTAHSPDRSIGTIAPDELYRIPIAGGPAEKLPIEKEMQMSVVGADDAFVYLFGMEVPPDPAARPAGLYRVPHEGGDPERLVATGVDAVPMRDFVDLGDVILYRSMDDVYRVEKASGASSRIVRSPCLARMTVADDALFLALLPPDEDVVTIVRVPYR